MHRGKDDMAITFYYGSGSPYAWRVHLALEHKALPYERKVLSFSAGDTRKPEFVAGTLSAADYAFYPLVAFMNRSETKLPNLNADGMLTPQLAAWKARIEALPYFDGTIPPHWKNK